MSLRTHSRTANRSVLLVATIWGLLTMALVTPMGGRALVQLASGDNDYTRFRQPSTDYAKPLWLDAEVQAVELGGPSDVAHSVAGTDPFNGCAVIEEEWAHVVKRNTSPGCV